MALADEAEFNLVHSPRHTTETAAHFKRTTRSSSAEERAFEILTANEDLTGFAQSNLLINPTHTVFSPLPLSLTAELRGAPKS